MIRESFRDRDKLCFSPQRYAGMILILAGLAIVVLPKQWLTSLASKWRMIRKGV